MELAKRPSWQQNIVTGMEYLPGISFYVKSRGWHFLLSWGHRISGVGLVLYLLVHLYTLYALMTPGEYAAKMTFYSNPFFVFLEWAIAVPLLFHALNGMRLVLFESFHIRDERVIIQGIIVIGIAYLASLAYVMAAGDQSVSFGVFWLFVSILSLIAGWVVLLNVLKAVGSVLWKLQRVTGAFLLPLASGHMLFMHINHLAGHDTATVLLRMQTYTAKILDFILFAFILFHGTYGIVGLVNDYVRNDTTRRILNALIIAIMALSALAGIRLIVAV